MPGPDDDWPGDEDDVNDFGDGRLDEDWRERVLERAFVFERVRVGVGTLDPCCSGVDGHDEELFPRRKVFDRDDIGGVDSVVGAGTLLVRF